MRIPVVIQRFGVAIALLLFPFSSTAPLLAQIPSPAPTVTGNTLISPSTGIDYTPLKKLLEAQQWQAANEMTRSLMLKNSGRDAQGWQTAEDIQKIACWDLKTIDDLWKTYSNGRYGFSVQYGIFLSTGNKPGRLMAPEAFDKFGDQIGWRENNEWILFKQNLHYTADGPRGHLPNPRDEYQINGGRLEYTNLTKRLNDCQIVSIPSINSPGMPLASPSPKPSVKASPSPKPKATPKVKTSPAVKPKATPSPKASTKPKTVKPKTSVSPQPSPSASMRSKK